MGLNLSCAEVMRSSAAAAPRLTPNEATNRTQGRMLIQGLLLQVSYEKPWPAYSFLATRRGSLGYPYRNPQSFVWTVFGGLHGSIGTITYDGAPGLCIVEIAYCLRSSPSTAATRASPPDHQRMNRRRAPTRNRTTPRCQPGAQTATVIPQNNAPQSVKVRTDLYAAAEHFAEISIGFRHGST